MLFLTNFLNFVEKKQRESGLKRQALEKALKKYGVRDFRINDSEYKFSNVDLCTCSEIDFFLTFKKKIKNQMEMLPAEKRKIYYEVQERKGEARTYTEFYAQTITAGAALLACLVSLMNISNPGSVGERFSIGLGLFFVLVLIILALYAIHQCHRWSEKMYIKMLTEAYEELEEEYDNVN